MRLDSIAQCWHNHSHPHHNLNERTNERTSCAQIRAAHSRGANIDWCKRLFILATRLWAPVINAPVPLRSTGRSQKCGTAQRSSTAPISPKWKAYSVCVCLLVVCCDFVRIRQGQNRCLRMADCACWWSAIRATALHGPSTAPKRPSLSSCCMNARARCAPGMCAYVRRAMIGARR